MSTIQKLLKTERFQTKIVLTYAVKFLYQKILLPKPKEQKILFIVGCQRSGTSLMNRIFTQDLQVSVYRESSILSSNDRGFNSKGDFATSLRLNSPGNLAKNFNQNKAPMIVLKPLVESQNIQQLLDFFPQAKALWMYRNYRDVAQSNHRRFKNNGEIAGGIRDIKFIAQGDRANWRSEKASETVRSVITKYFAEDMNPYDASALFWWARNRLFSELNLSQNPRVLLCRYENLVTQPKQVMRQIYRFVDAPYKLHPQFDRDIDTDSLGKGKSIKLSPEIEKLCSDLWQQLNNNYQQQMSGARL